MTKAAVQALVVLGLFLTMPWATVLPSSGMVEPLNEGSTPFVMPAMAMQADFNGTGWNLSGTSWDTNDNEVVIDRPSVAWSSPPGAPQFPRAAACLFPIPERNEMWLVGGVVDPSSQWNDEEESSLMEIYDVTNGTWSVAPNPIPNTQSYAGCARWGDTLVLAGDCRFLTRNPRCRPSRQALSSGTTSPPTLVHGHLDAPAQAVGKAGYAHHDGVLYVAGGVNQTGSVMALNTTMSYDIDADTWTTGQNLTTPRVQPAAAYYRGQLYVMGGYETTLTSSGGGGPPSASWDITNTTEVMASNGSWSNHTDLGVALAGAGATVIHDEIVLMGGASSTEHNAARTDGCPRPTRGATWGTSSTPYTACHGRTTTTPPSSLEATQATPRGVGCSFAPRTTAT